MTDHAMSKDLQKWFDGKIMQAMKDFVVRSEVVEMEPREAAAIMCTELMAACIKLIGNGSTFDANEAGKIFAEGINLIRKENEERKKMQEMTDGSRHNII